METPSRAVFLSKKPFVPGKTYNSDPHSSGFTDDFIYVCSKAYPSYGISYPMTAMGIMGRGTENAIVIDSMGGAVGKLEISGVRVGDEYFGHNAFFMREIRKMRSIIQLSSNAYVLRIYNASMIGKDGEVNYIKSMEDTYHDFFVYISDVSTSIRARKPNSLEVSIQFVQRNALRGFNEYIPDPVIPESTNTNTQQSTTLMNTPLQNLTDTGDSMELQEYGFYFGLRGVNSGGLKVRPWHLKHVQKYGVSLSSMSTEIGLPNQPPERAQIFDMSGPVRRFKIEGLRYDYDEEVSNVDFMFSRRENSPKYKWKNPITYREEPNCTSLSMSGTFSIIQASIPGFVLGIYPTVTDGDNPADNLIETGTYNVAIDNISMNFTNKPGEIEYSISLIERAKMGNYDITKLMGN